LADIALWTCLLSSNAMDYADDIFPELLRDGAADLVDPDTFTYGDQIDD